MIGAWVIDGNYTSRSAAEVRRILHGADDLVLRLEASELGQWDSALIAFLKTL